MFDFDYDAFIANTTSEYDMWNQDENPWDTEDDSLDYFSIEGMKIA